MPKAPTPEELAARLLAVRGVSRAEDLRGRLPHDYRTLQRWMKEGYPKPAAALLELLTETGYFDPEHVPNLTAAKLERARRLAVEIADHAEKLADLL